MENVEPRATAPPGSPSGAELAALTTPRFAICSCADTQQKAYPEHSGLTARPKLWVFAMHSCAGRLM
jgi:hypothetical protein